MTAMTGDDDADGARRARIEVFDGAHVTGIADLILGIQQGEFGIPITYDQQPDLRDIAGFYQRDLGNFWLAVAGARVVGTIALLDIGDRQSALRKMFVAADHRGPEHALGQRLLSTLLDHARRAGLERIFLGTTDTFLAAHRFYEKNGFIRLDPRDLPTGFPRMAVDTRFYALTL